MMQTAQLTVEFTTYQREWSQTVWNVREGGRFVSRVADSLGYVTHIYHGAAATRAQAEEEAQMIVDDCLTAGGIEALLALDESLV